MKITILKFGKEGTYMSKVKDFTKGKIFSPLVTFIIPILAALFLQTMYGAVDLLVVG